MHGGGETTLLVLVHPQPRVRDFHRFHELNQLREEGYAHSPGSSSKSSTPSLAHAAAPATEETRPIQKQPGQRIGMH